MFQEKKKKRKKSKLRENIEAVVFALVIAPLHAPHAKAPARRITPGDLGLLKEPSQPDQKVGARLAGPGYDGTMPVEPRQIQGPRMQTTHPLRDALPTYIMPASRLVLGNTRANLGHCAEDVAHRVDLARQHIAGQHPLSCPTSKTACHPDLDAPVPLFRLQSSFNHGSRQLQLIGSATKTDTTLEYARSQISTGKDLFISDRIHGKYVDHTYPATARVGGKGMYLTPARAVTSFLLFSLEVYCTQAGLDEIIVKRGLRHSRLGHDTVPVPSRCRWRIDGGDHSTVPPTESESLQDEIEA